MPIFPGFVWLLFAHRSINKTKDETLPHFDAMHGEEGTKQSNTHKIATSKPISRMCARA